MPLTELDIAKCAFLTDAFIALNPAAHEGVKVRIGGDRLPAPNLKRGTGFKEYRHFAIESIPDWMRCIDKNTEQRSGTEKRFRRRCFLVGFARCIKHVGKVQPEITLREL